MRNLLKYFFIISIAILHIRCAESKEWKVKTTLHFEIYHHNLTPRELKDISYTLEEIYKKTTRWLGLTDSLFLFWHKKAKVYIFDTQQEYQKFTGAPSWSQGRSNLTNKTIYVYKDAPLLKRNILPHEIGHFVFYEITGNKENIPDFLKEGVATQQEGYIRSRILRTRALIEKNAYIPFKELVTIKVKKLPKRRIPDFYAQSFSIVYFLLKQYPKRLFIDMCTYLKQGLSFPQAFRKSYFGEIDNLTQLEEKWKNYWLKR